MSLATVKSTDVASFIAANVSPVDGDLFSELSGPTEKTRRLWSACQDLLKQEYDRGGCLGLDVSKACGITSHEPGYIVTERSGDDDVVVGLQTERPLVRGVKPLGGARLTRRACVERGADETEREALNALLAPFDPTSTAHVRRTHNDCVFDLYDGEMRAARKNHIVTGLPDAYGRGRVLGDYRRVALSGVDALVTEKKNDRAAVLLRARTKPNKAKDFVTDHEISFTSEETTQSFDHDSVFQLADEISCQIDALSALKKMAFTYGFDVSRAARSAKEAFQWLYFAYLAAVKEDDGAAISLGRVDAFLDIFIERDLRTGALKSESAAQELVDNLVMKLRLVRHLRPKAYDDLFAGDPVWATCAIGGCAKRGHLVTKTSWRFLRTLENLGPAPEPNLTVLWDADLLPSPFKAYAAKSSIATSAIQYENDKAMRVAFESDDVGVSCCVSGLVIGRDTQFFGARVNLPKLLLYALNGGIDEITGARVAPASLDDALGGALDKTKPLSYADVKRRFDTYAEWLAGVYVDAMCRIHWSHDRYYYESLMMALIDSEPRRFMAFGVAGLSCLVDSLSAVKHAERVVPTVHPETGVIVSFEAEGAWPAFGNDDPRVDTIAAEVTRDFLRKLRERGRLYRGATPTLSVLTITSNVMYGRNTGATPDGRLAGAPFAPGANPMHERDVSGALSSLNSVSRIPYDKDGCLDGISNTFSISSSSLGKTDRDRNSNLVALLDEYFSPSSFRFVQPCASGVSADVGGKQTGANLASHTSSFLTTDGGHHLNVNVIDRETLVDAMKFPSRYPNLTVRISGYAVRFNALAVELQEEIVKRTFHERV